MAFYVYEVCGNTIAVRSLPFLSNLVQISQEVPRIICMHTGTCACTVTHKSFFLEENLRIPFRIKDKNKQTYLSCFKIYLKNTKN